MALPKSHKEYPIYRAWILLRYRCNNPTGKNRWYKNIGYAARWEDFNNFYTDMVNGWQKGLTLDRIDGSKGYSKNNCRWATHQQQMNNKSDNRFIDYDGTRFTITQWAKKLNMRRTTLRMRLDEYGWSIEKAFNTPVRERSI